MTNSQTHDTRYPSKITQQEQDKEDDKGSTDVRDICQVTDVTEEYLETTEGEEVELLDD